MRRRTSGDLLSARRSRPVSCPVPLPYLTTVHLAFLVRLSQFHGFKPGSAGTSGLASVIRDEPHNNSTREGLYGYGPINELIVERSITDHPRGDRRRSQRSPHREGYHYSATAIVALAQNAAACRVA